jgi:hypothetical protein
MNEINPTIATATNGIEPAKKPIKITEDITSLQEGKYKLSDARSKQKVHIQKMFIRPEKARLEKRWYQDVAPEDPDSVEFEDQYKQSMEGMKGTKR